jgi:hypothetical protein
VRQAKAHVAALFADDTDDAPALESVQKKDGAWQVVLSFSRRKPLKAGGAGLAMDPALANYFIKVQLKSGTGELVSITDNALS